MSTRAKLLSFLNIIGLSILIACGGGSGQEETPVEPIEPPITNTFRIGTAPFAIQQERFNCEAFLAAQEKLPEWRISWLWNTFGSRTDCLFRVLDDPRLREIQVHIMNDVCVRNRNCGPYEALAGFTIGEMKWRIESGDPIIREIFRRAAQDLADFLYRDYRLQDKPDIACYISPLLETNLSPGEFRQIVDIFRPIFPGCEIVYNPVSYKNDLGGADYEETHNPRQPIQPPCVFNNDGTSVKFPGKPNGYPRLIEPDELVDSFLNRRFCEARYIWHHSYNCIRPDLGFIDPRDRPCNETDTWNDLADIIVRGN
jgi:hypothetical protein